MQHKLTSISLALFIMLLIPSAASAWDFTCSPKTESKVEVAPPPNLMVMLDRSGSMTGGDMPVTCRVCEMEGRLWEVSGRSDCSGGTPWARTASSSVPKGSGSGVIHSYTITGAPAGPLRMDVDVAGDYGGTCEYVDIYVDGDFIDTFDPDRECGSASTTIEIPDGYSDDGQLVIELRSSPDNNSCHGNNSSCEGGWYKHKGKWYYENPSCDGVDLFCSDNSASIKVYNNVPIYHGSKAWKDPCGSANKWEQAVDAIDLITATSDAATPQLGSFGLGWFSRTSASIIRDCVPDNNRPIMSSLNGTSPSGNTPTGTAIRTALNSSCIGSGASETQSASVARDSSNAGYEYELVFRDIPPQSADLNLSIQLYGDFGSSCEFAAVSADGQYLGYMTDSTDCRSSGFNQTFTVPAALAADGKVRIRIVTRAQGTPTTSPSCSSSSGGVEAYCSDNHTDVTLSYQPSTLTSSATMLINDGSPTRDFNGNSTNAYRDGIVAACEHRAVAPAYVVGLGSGTDSDYNNIMAAAGGTGTCLPSASGSVDPCDNTGRWSDFKGRCEGSYVASDGDGLISAMGEIASTLSCTFPVSFLGASVSEIPVDPTNEYPYLYVDVYQASTASIVRLHNAGSSKSNAGEGWVFSNDLSRTHIKLTDGYCEMASKQEVQVVSTQLACLCQEPAGSVCTVPNSTALDLCPEGVWACNEGTDYCEPDATCCIPDEPCSTGDLGICEAGTRVCDGSPRGICVGVEGPSGEVCDGLDNNCDGNIDEDLSQVCSTAGLGRCAIGHELCNNGVWEPCVSKFQPMPETCNGLDDDCDGDVDDITESWKDGAFASYTVPKSQLGQVCDFKNTCMCPGGTDEHVGGSFDEYMDQWQGNCECGAGLSEGANYTPAPEADAPQAGAEPQAGCSSVPGQGSPLPLGIFLGMMFVGLRRRRK